MVGQGGTVNGIGFAWVHLKPYGRDYVLKKGYLSLFKRPFEKFSIQSVRSQSEPILGHGQEKETTIFSR